MSIHNWRHIDTAGGLALPKAQPTRVEYKAPDLSHAERLAHAGTMMTFARQDRATQRQQQTRRWLIAAGLFILAVIAAVIWRGK